MFDKVKLSTFEKVKKVVVLDDLKLSNSRSPECSTASSCSRRVEQSYFHVFCCCCKICATGLDLILLIFCITLLMFSSVYSHC